MQKLQTKWPTVHNSLTHSTQGALLTPEEEARQASKKAEKKKAQRAVRKEKEKEIKEEEKIKVVQLQSDFFFY